jgi:hypothetical protein
MNGRSVLIGAIAAALCASACGEAGSPTSSRDSPLPTLGTATLAPTAPPTDAASYAASVASASASASVAASAFASARAAFAATSASASAAALNAPALLYQVTGVGSATVTYFVGSSEEQQEVTLPWSLGLTDAQLPGTAVLSAQLQGTGSISCAIIHAPGTANAWTGGQAQSSGAYVVVTCTH